MISRENESASDEPSAKGTLTTDGTTTNPTEQARDKAGRGLRVLHPDRNDPRHQEARRKDPK